MSILWNSMTLTSFVFTELVNPLNTRLLCYCTVSDTKLFYDVIVISCNQTRRSPGLVSDWSPSIPKISGARIWLVSLNHGDLRGSYLIGLPQSRRSPGLVSDWSPSITEISGARIWLVSLNHGDLRGSYLIGLPQSRRSPGLVTNWLIQ